MVFLTIPYEPRPEIGAMDGDFDLKFPDLLGCVTLGVSKTRFSDNFDKKSKRNLIGDVILSIF